MPSPFDRNREIKAALNQEARRLGFDEVRVTKAAVTEQTSLDFDAFIAGGYHGDMHWMAETAGRRRHPEALWSDAKTVISVAVNYGPAVDPLPELDHQDAGYISVYARGRDYHDVIKKRLKALARWLVEASREDVKVFVDTAPVLEKPLAAASGLGWQGKHTNLVSRAHGSWLFLGEIFTTLELPADAPETDHCGSCRRCLDVCPTGAFLDAHRIDARRCVSYLTIEHKGHIPRDLRQLMGNRIYGCDDCLAVCPWNKFAQTAHDNKLKARPDLEQPPLADLAQLNDSEFRIRFAGSPIKRIGRDRFVRNVLIAIGNSARTEFAPLTEDLCEDDSALVRAAAIWALLRLSPNRAMELKTDRMHAEDDPEVRQEWSEV